ncbi:hypothetical protein [Nocardia sp. NPDC051832]|uniref:hypothetical protein n=1 Tax=Nocardia sp. NPDC051832 TaxID=3155673 RepID=UPI003433AD0A
MRRATAGDPVPSVELASVTVRFLVPRDLGYARADAARGARADAIALAVWAFQVADSVDRGAESVEVTVGAAADGVAAVTAAGSVLGPLGDLLADGVVHSGGQLPAIFAAAQRDLDRAGARWPHDALGDLLDQLAAYTARSARHDPLHTAALVAELVARHRASRRDWVPALGTEEPAQTPLRHLRLTGLGAQVRGDAESRSVEVYLAHTEARIVLTLPHTITATDGQELPDATVLGARRTGPARLAEYAAGNVVTESATRSANRTVRLANNRIARTSVLPSAGNWENLPPELLIGDLTAESARLATLPPALIRPRVRGESVRALVVDSVEDVHYLPAEQRLLARLHGPVGSVLAHYTHSTAAAGAIDALTQAFSGIHGPIRYIAGPLERHAGQLTVTPTAVVAGTTVIVPAFAQATTLETPTSPLPQPDPLSAALTSALSCTAELIHRGTRHLPPSWSTRAAESAATLRRAGFTTAATSLDALRAAISPDSPPLPTLATWADTHLRLLLTAEQL